MVETRHPDVFIIERPATPRVVGIGTSTGAFIGITERGPIDKADFVTSQSQFIRKYGSFYKGSPLIHAIKGFFDEGGSRAFIIRIVGVGSAEAERDFKNQSSEALPAALIGLVDLVSATVDLSVKKYLNLDIDNGGPAPVGIDLSSLAALPSAATGAEIIAAINAATAPGVATLGAGGELVLTSPTTGPLSEVEIRPAAEAAVIASFTGSGFFGGGINVGNKDIILNIDSLGDLTIDISVTGITAADVVIDINAALLGAGAYGAPYSTAASVSAGEIKLDGLVLGPAGSIVIKDGPAGTSAKLEVFGLPEGGGDHTFLGSTVDAVTLVTGLAEGPTYTTIGSLAIADFMKLLAINPGEWGNGLSIDTERWKTTTTAILGAVDKIAVSAVSSIRVGDVVRIYDGVSEIFRHVNEIDLSLKEIKFLGEPNAGPSLASGALVHSSSTHRFVTEVVDAISAGETTARLLSAGAVTEGVRIILDDKGINGIISVVVKKVNGSVITFDPIVSDVAAGAIASSMHFNLIVREGGEAVEEHAFLSAEGTDIRDFFEKRLSGDRNESKLIEAEDLAPIISDPILSNPIPVLEKFLLGGLDGTTPLPLDFLGTEEPVAGMFFLADNDEFSMFSMPGIEDIFVLRSAIAFAERLGRVMFLLESPLSDDEPLEVLDFRNVELAIDSSYAALYYPWMLVRDPESDNPQALITIPPTGHMQGLWAKVAQNRGVHKAPAGLRDGNISTAFDLTYKISDGEHDLLNPEGINVIRFFRGQGFKVMGARTLWRNNDGFHYISTRRLLNFVKESIRRANRFAIFEPNDPSLWRKLTSINSEFLNSLWQRGMLFPSNDVSSAFFVQCDGETNPQSEIDRGRVNCRIGINPPFPAEFVIFNIGLFDGGGDVTEAFGTSS